MSFHADFWVVAGTAAPIIALSAILVDSDQLQLAIDLEVASGMPEDIPMWKWTADRWAIFGWSVITLIITFFQALILAVSLLSLAGQSNYFSPVSVALAESASLVLLGLISLRLVQQRYWVRRTEQEKRALALRSKILRHPSRKAQSNAFRRATRYRSKRPVANTRRTRNRPNNVSISRKKDLRLSCTQSCGQASWHPLVSRLLRPCSLST
jgi:hypothetical protein